MKIAQRLSALTLIATLLGTSVLAGCGSRDKAIGNDTLVAIIPSDGATLNPLFTKDAYSNYLQAPVFNGLATVNPGYRIGPDLATSWQNSSDNLHWIVHLRHDVRWSDGVPFTAADVVWTWKAMLDPETGFPYQGQFTYIKSVSAVDSYTVRFDLSQPNALFVTGALTADILPKHILGKVPDKQLIGSDFSEHPIGTGPYIVVQWQRDDHILYRANPTYYKGAPRIPKFMFRVIFNTETAGEALREGEAQMLYNVDANTVQELQGVPHIKIFTKPSTYTGILLVNHRRPQLNDNMVLQAMMYGWDRKAISEGLYRGVTSVATGITPLALGDWYDPHVKLYPFDPDRAKAVLDKAGWKVGSDGIRARDGKRLEFVVISPDRTGQGADYLAAYQADMAAIGIRIGVQLLDWSTYLEKEDSGDFDLASESWGGSYDPDQFTFFDSTQTPPTGNNYMYYKDKAVDRDVRLGLTTVDPKKRKALYDDMQRRTAEHLAVLFVSYRFARIAVTTRLGTVKGTLDPGVLFYNMEDWTLAPK